MNHLPESCPGLLPSQATKRAEHIRVAKRLVFFQAGLSLWLGFQAYRGFIAPPPIFCCNHDGAWPVSMLGAVVTCGLAVYLVRAIRRDAVSDGKNTIATVLWVIVFIFTGVIGYGGCLGV